MCEAWLASLSKLIHVIYLRNLNHCKVHSSSYSSFYRTLILIAVALGPILKFSKTVRITDNRVTSLSQGLKVLMLTSFRFHLR